MFQLKWDQLDNYLKKKKILNVHAKTKFWFILNYGIFFKHSLLRVLIPNFKVRTIQSSITDSQRYP